MKKRSLLAIYLQNPACCHMVSFGNFHGRQTQHVNRYKNFFFIYLKQIFKQLKFSATRTKVQKYLLLTALCGVP